MREESVRKPDPPPYNPEFREPSEAEEIYYQARFGQGEDVNAAGSQNRPQKHATNREVGGAAALGTVAGLAVAGPVLGIAAGVGAAAVATSHSGSVGSHTRQTGEAVAKVGDRAKEMDKKHRLSERTKKAANDAARKSKEIDEKYQIVNKSKQAVNDAKKKARDINDKHRVVEKSKNAARSVADKAKDINEKHQVSEKTKKAASMTWNKTLAGAKFVSSKINKNKT